MGKYRRKPIEVDAWQWSPSGDFDGIVSKNIWGKSFVITIHGQRAYLACGDWIIAEPGGKYFYPCKPDIFDATYERVVCVPMPVLS